MSGSEDDEMWRRLKKTVRPLKKPASRRVSEVNTPAGKKSESRVVVSGKSAKPQKLPVSLPPYQDAPSKPESNGIDRRTDDKLRRGQLPIEARIDLHGMTKAQAHDALKSFISGCWNAEKRVLLVITGKGGRSAESGEGVLRKTLPLWLRDTDIAHKILSFHQARPQHGGAGAFYVLLRRQRKPAADL